MFPIKIKIRIVLLIFLVGIIGLSFLLIQQFFWVKANPAVVSFEQESSANENKDSKSEETVEARSERQKREKFVEDWKDFDMTQVDVNTFEIVSSGLAKDKNHVYYRSSSVGVSYNEEGERAVNVTNEFGVVDSINPEGFEYLGGDYWTTEYVKNNDRVYFKPAGEKKEDFVFSVVEGADPVSFEVATGGMFTGKDVAHTYVQDVTVDLESFEETESYAYAKDQYRVYSSFGLGTEWNQILEGADPENFHMISGVYATDGKNVYGFCYAYEWMCISDIENADPKTFEPIDEVFSKDQTYVYWLGQKIEGADPATFSADGIGSGGGVDGVFYFDKYAVYYIDPMNQHRFEEFDPSTFKIISTTRNDNSYLLQASDKFGKYKIILISKGQNGPIGIKFDFEVEALVYE